MLAESWNRDWEFCQKENGRHKKVTLPHDAMINTRRNPDMRNYFLLAGFEGGTYEYRKIFLPQEEKEHMFLEAEGIYCMSQVYVNGILVREKQYGFTAFSVDMAPFLKIGEENEVLVRVNVPKEGHNRWYTGGGIYRPVNLYTAGADYIPLYGIKVTTLSIGQGEGSDARILVETQVYGEGEVFVEVREGKGASSIKGKKAAAGTGRRLELVIPKAQLWDADSPFLYTAHIWLRKNGETVDEAVETFGIRIVKVIPEKGLFVNGKHTFLRGGCIHCDNGVIGVVNNDVTELRRAKIIKRSGFNAIRSAHHPMSRSLMRACDEVGLYVMDEAFDSWYRPKAMNPYVGHFEECWREDVTAMVQDAYNHPSVILYSLGNEIPEGGSLKAVRIGRQMLECIHSYDTTRLTTFCPSVHWLREYLDGTPYLTQDEDQWMAENPENKEVDWKHYMKIFMGAAANIPEDEKDMDYPPTYVRMDEDATKNLYPYLDVAGYNYFEDKYDVLHELHPERLLLGTETRGVLLAKTMEYARTHPFLIGDFVWTLQDHLGETNCCNLSYEGEEQEAELPPNLRGKAYPWLINCGGVIDILGNELPSLHRYALAWGKEKGIFLAAQPPIHQGKAPRVSSYRWTDSVEGWTFEGYEGEKTFVDVYTDAAEAEVWVNGISIGRKKPEGFWVKFPCIYEPGILRAVGYDIEGRVLYETEERTAEPETVIRVKSDKTLLRAGGEDFCFLSIGLEDCEGRKKELPEREISIKIEGDVSLEGFGSAYHKNKDPFDGLVARTYMGRLLAVVRSGKTGGKAQIILSSPELEDVEVILDVEEQG